MSQATLTRKDFASGIDVKWCPGCGDYAILAAIQNTMPKIGVPKEKIVFVSGIGCSSRFPHYMSTYGFHTIHGRAPALATGLKLANPDLSVWVVTGDGDGLSIGGNHLMHAVKRNVGLKVMLFNNNIYGLTKGQVSPTSQSGTVTKSTPLGSVDGGLNPVNFALSVGATFVARTMDVNPRHMQEVFMAASEHKGIAFIEILQNCVIFNNGVHMPVVGSDNKANTQLMLKDGEPMIFGENNEKGIRVNPKNLELEVVTIGEDGVTPDDILVHDASTENPALLTLLANLKEPTAFGVIKSVEKPAYEDMIHDQISEYQKLKGEGDLQKVISSGDTWTIE